MTERLRDLAEGQTGALERSSAGGAAGIPRDVAAVLRLQRSAGNAAVTRLLEGGQTRGPVLQRQITIAGDAYGTNSTRPGWSVGLEGAVLDEYNRRFGTTFDELPFTDLKLARAHEGAFEQIQAQIVSYLNGTASQSEFDTWVVTFTATLRAAPGSGAEVQGIDGDRTALENARGQTPVDRGRVVERANALLSKLNSLSTNVRAGDKYLNSYIGMFLDLVFVRTDRGMQLTEHGRNLVSLGCFGDLPRTPHRGETLVTSQGGVRFDAMTPNVTRPTLEAYSSTQRAIGSNNVNSRLYGSSAMSNFAQIDSAQTSPAPASPGQGLDQAWADQQFAEFLEWSRDQQDEPSEQGGRWVPYDERTGSEPAVHSETPSYDEDDDGGEGGEVADLYEAASEWVQSAATILSQGDGDTVLEQAIS